MTLLEWGRGDSRLPGNTICPSEGENNDFYDPAPASLAFSVTALTLDLFLC